jgi:hypothetical protein
MTILSRNYTESTQIGALVRDPHCTPVENNGYRVARTNEVEGLKIRKKSTLGLQKFRIEHQSKIARPDRPADFQQDWPMFNLSYARNRTGATIVR